jgi:hypothetical protein
LSATERYIFIFPALYLLCLTQIKISNKRKEKRKEKSKNHQQPGYQICAGFVGCSQSFAPCPEKLSPNATLTQRKSGITLQGARGDLPWVVADPAARFTLMGVGLFGVVGVVLAVG